MMTARRLQRKTAITLENRKEASQAGADRPEFFRKKKYLFEN